MNLVIVESPTKARKLSEYLGKDYKVEASIGHVRDLPKNKLGIDLDHNFEPTYEVDEDKKKVVSQLEKLAQKADTIYLATDPDREGEAIAWHIQELLKKGKHKAHFVRSTFHEITKSAVMAAIEKPQELSMHLVDAQQARRVVDRLVGYQVSPVLWKKVRRGLSAGRVQSVALRLIVEREKEIEKFKPDEYWEVDVLLDTQLGRKLDVAAWEKTVAKNKPSKKESDEATTPHQTAKGWQQTPPPETLVARVIEVDGKTYTPKTQSDVTIWLKSLPTAHYKVVSIERKSRERVSLPPFTTSTLQQAASTRFGFTSKQTMSLAQNLYEEGLITYHRTDSVALSQQSIGMAREYIEKNYGEAYVPEKPRYFANKSKNAQEAHEAIRVTDLRVPGSVLISKYHKFTERHEKLYDLIWRRFVASQMNAAVYDQTAIIIEATHPTAHSHTARLRSSGSILKFDGWMKLFQSQEDTILPAVNEGQELLYGDLSALQKFTQPPPRYNDASLVKELEKRGIGRPSTYASIISVIVDRGYVERQEKRFFATAVGITVSDFLVTNFSNFMEYDFTAEMEEDLDRIARGEKAWRKIVKEFYEPLAKKITTVTKEADRVQIPVEETGEDCPTCGATEHGKIVIRTGRFGKFKSCSRYPECDFTENIVEKVENVKCPLCQEGEVIIKNSRWGKSFFGCSRYPECNWASWQKPTPGMRVTAEEWAQQQAEREARKAARAEKFKKTNGSSTASSAKKTKPATKAKPKTTAKKTRATAKR